MLCRWQLLRRVLFSREWLDLLARHGPWKYVWLPDDDVRASSCDVAGLFAMMDAAQLQLAQVLCVRQYLCVCLRMGASSKAASAAHQQGALGAPAWPAGCRCRSAESAAPGSSGRPSSSDPALLCASPRLWRSWRQVLHTQAQGIA